MTQVKFWELIDAAASKAKGDSERFIEVLTEKLEGLTPDELVEFKVCQEVEMHRAFTWDLWGAAYIINGGCSDDGFEYFRAWLMSRGSKVWEAALANAESLAAVKGVEPDECELEELLYVAVNAYEGKTDGGDLYAKMQDRKDQPKAPSGTAWKEDGDDLDRRFPKLCKKFSDD